MPLFPDHFSSVAATYARYRPTYPDGLFDWLATLAPGRDLAWDCACGSGQATLPLAQRFHRVIATDASGEQLACAPAHPQVEWRIATAESSGIAEGSVDLITVAQALHWFDQERFWTEARRVARDGALIAAWSYGVAALDDAGLTTMLIDLHDNVVGPCWPIERGHVDLRYTDIAFPFQRIEAPGFELSARWTLDQLAGYLRSWSATRRYVEAHQVDPIDAFTERIRSGWGSGRHAIHWPLTILVGRVSPWAGAAPDVDPGRRP